MTTTVRPATDRYLEALTRAARKLRLPIEDEILADAREHFSHAYPQATPTYRQICEEFGPPLAVAYSYRDLAAQYAADGHPEHPRRWYRWAPGWNLTCLSCGRTASAESARPIVVRKWAWSWQAYKLVWCRECRFLRVASLWRAKRRKSD